MKTLNYNLVNLDILTYEIITEGEFENDDYTTIYDILSESIESEITVDDWEYGLTNFEKLIQLVEKYLDTDDEFEVKVLETLRTINTNLEDSTVMIMVG